MPLWILPSPALGHESEILGDMYEKRGMVSSPPASRQRPMPSQAAGEKGSNSITSRLYAPSATFHLKTSMHRVTDGASPDMCEPGE